MEVLWSFGFAVTAVMHICRMDKPVHAIRNLISSNVPRDIACRNGTSHVALEDTNVGFITTCSV